MIIVDIEASGLNPDKHSIVSIGAVELKNPKNQYYGECKIPEGAEISPEAMKVNGFTTEQIKDPKKKSVKELLKDLFEWVKKIDNRTMAGQNTWFDRDFILKNAVEYKLEYPFSFRILDMHTLAYCIMLMKGHNPVTKEGKTHISSSTIYQYVGIPEEPKPHIAINGAKYEGEAINRLLYGKYLLEEFKKYKVPEFLKTT